MTADKEKRRAISREAARRRRRVESEVFGDLSSLLPLQPSVRAHLDKPSVIRLTLSYIRMHALLKENPGIKTEGSKAVKYPQFSHTDGRQERDGEPAVKEQKGPEEEEVESSEEMKMYLRTLEGFLMVLSVDGDMIFLSDNVSKYMGLTQTELMGHNILEFIHPCDHEEIRNNLRFTPAEVWFGGKRDFVMRIKSALTHRGRSTNLKSATWKVLHCQGRVKRCMGTSVVSCLLLTCQPLPLSHTLLSSNTFTSQHSMDMRFTYCDQRVMNLLGFSPEELHGQSIYNLCHTLDTKCLTKNHFNLCLKTQSVSGQYRMLVKGGGYVWVETHSAVIPSAKPSKSRPSAHHQLCIICVTYVLSGVEEPSLQLSLDQTIPRYQC